MRRYGMFFTMIFTICVLSACLQQERVAYFKDTNSTDLSQESIKDLRLFETLDDKFKNKHKGLKYKTDLLTDLYDYYEINDVIVAFNKENKKLERIMVTDTATKTYRGVSIGDSVKKIKEYYGDDSYERIEQSMNILGYVDHDTNTTIEFWYHEEDNVEIIRLDSKSIQ